MSVLPKLSDKLLPFCKTRKHDKVLNRQHVGHSYLTHSFSLKTKTKEEPPVFAACNSFITIKHILIECAALVEVRKKILRRDLCIHFSEV